MLLNLQIKTWSQIHQMNQIKSDSPPILLISISVKCRRTLFFFKAERELDY